MQKELEQVRYNLQTELEQQRQEKDARIAELEDEFEKFRQSKTSTINQQTIEIKELRKTVISHESSIISLQEILRKKEDVEAQLATT